MQDQGSSSSRHHVPIFMTNAALYTRADLSKYNRHKLAVHTSKFGQSKVTFLVGSSDCNQSDWLICDTPILRSSVTKHNDTFLLSNSEQSRIAVSTSQIRQPIVWPNSWHTFRGIVTMHCGKVIQGTWTHNAVLHGYCETQWCCRQSQGSIHKRKLIYLTFNG